MKRLFNWIGSDGLMHIMACFGMTAALGNYVNAGMALFISSFIGFLKEIVWDARLGKGEFQWKDIVCDLIGAFAGFLIVLGGSLLEK